MTSGQLHMLLRDRPGARRAAEEGMRQAIEHGFPLLRGALRFIVAWAPPAPDVAGMIAGLDEARALGTGHQVPGHLGLIAEALGVAGRASEGLAYIADALAQVERTGERCHEAELHRLRGELLQSQRGPRSEAESHFRDAIALARRQGALLWELRAATSLCRLRRRGDAVTTLAAVCDRFPAGSRLDDLDAARALLAGGR